MIAIVCFAFAATPGTPAPASALAVEKARTLYDDAEFAKVITFLESALADGSIAEADRVQAYVLLGSSFVALRKDDAARQAFRWVVGNEPGYRLPTFTAPRIRNLFDEVHAKRPRISIDSVSFPNALQAQLLVSEANPEDSAGILYWRCQPQTRYAQETVSAPGRTVNVTLPNACTTLEYYAELVSGREVFARDGRATEPKLANAPFASTPTVTTTPYYKSWWFWTIISGAVVGGAAATTAVLLTRPQSNTASVEIRGVSR